MNNKDTIYVDVEDEITNIIDKVISSKSKVVALVLPKRATVFQSIVNMKLLKKKADSAKKSVVLVTSDKGLLPLAGAVGVHVANSLEAKPEIPPNPADEFDDDSPVSLDDDEPDSKELDKSKPVGELAGLAAVGAAVHNQSKDEPENIEFDNDALPGAAAGLDDIDNETKSKKDKKQKPKKAKGLDGKKTSIPDFEKFRKWLLIGAAALIVLIVAWIFGFKVLPKANIIVQTNTSNISSNLDVTLSQANGNVIVSSNTVPAKYETQTKTSTSSSVNTTGSKTIGTSATGTITIDNPCNLNGTTFPTTVAAGTQFTDSSGNYTYTSNNTITVPGYSAPKGKCDPGNASVAVTATAVGSSYNISPTSYTSTDSDLNGFSMNGNAMTGGSSSNVQVVAQADVASAQSQLPTPNSSQVEGQLESTLKQAGYTPISATYVAGTPSYSPSAAVGAQANSITVTETVTYSMYGAKQSDLNTLIVANVNQQINPASQSILDSGVSGATFTLQTSSSTTASAQVTMQASSTIGPKLNISSITTNAAGQKSADIISNISQIPGVTSVTVHYSPFWVTSTPHSVKKIHVTIEKANGSQP